MKHLHRLTDLHVFVYRYRRGMWEDHSAIPQERLGGDSLSSGGRDGKSNITNEPDWFTWALQILYLHIILYYLVKYRCILGK